MQELEKKLNYTFRDPSLLSEALSHSSYANEKRLKGGYNERIEFLGDAVLELVTSEFLYNNYPKMPEGEMTKTRASIVCEPTLALCAAEFSLGKYLYLGHGEEMSGGRERASIVSDAMEALIGALYLDAGYEVTRGFVVNSFKDIIEEAVDGKLFSDYKSRSLYIDLF